MWVLALWLLRSIKYGGSDPVPVSRPRLRQRFLFLKVFLLGSLNFMWTGSKLCGERGLQLCPAFQSFLLRHQTWQRRSYLGHRFLQSQLPTLGHMDQRQTPWLRLLWIPGQNKMAVFKLLTFGVLCYAAVGNWSIYLSITYHPYLVTSVHSGSRLLGFEFHRQDLVAMWSLANCFDFLCLRFIIYDVSILEFIS